MKDCLLINWDVIEKKHKNSETFGTTRKVIYYQPKKCGSFGQFIQKCIDNESIARREDDDDELLFCSSSSSSSSIINFQIPTPLPFISPQTPPSSSITWPLYTLLLRRRHQQRTSSRRRLCSKASTLLPLLFVCVLKIEPFRF